MAITKSYNKRMKRYYAYDTEYVWDDTKQKKVQKRRCIGYFDPISGKIMPTGPRGHVRTDDANVVSEQEQTSSISTSDTQQLAKLFHSTADMITTVSAALTELAGHYESMQKLLERKATSVD